MKAMKGRFLPFMAFMLFMVKAVFAKSVRPHPDPSRFASHPLRANTPSASSEPSVVKTWLE